MGLFCGFRRCSIWVQNKAESVNFVLIPKTQLKHFREESIAKKRANLARVFGLLGARALEISEGAHLLFRSLLNDGYTQINGHSHPSMAGAFFSPVMEVSSEP